MTGDRTRGRNIANAVLSFVVIIIIVSRRQHPLGAVEPHGSPEVLYYNYPGQS